MGREGRKKLGERARTRVVQKFELGNVVRRFEDFYLGLQRAGA
jgi:hypothetical protein